MMTPKIAQIARRFGSDDLDGTVVEEKIYHEAGATTSQSLRRSELLRLIREAGREPMERDTLYRPAGAHRNGVRGAGLTSPLWRTLQRSGTSFSREVRKILKSLRHTHSCVPRRHSCRRML
jgi:hypothetical protein